MDVWGIVIWAHLGNGIMNTLIIIIAIKPNYDTYCITKHQQQT